MHHSIFICSAFGASRYCFAFEQQHVRSRSPVFAGFIKRFSIQAENVQKRCRGEDRRPPVRRHALCEKRGLLNFTSRTRHRQIANNLCWKLINFAFAQKCRDSKKIHNSAQRFVPWRPPSMPFEMISGTIALFSTTYRVCPSISMRSPFVGKTIPSSP